MALPALFFPAAAGVEIEHSDYDDYIVDENPALEFLRYDWSLNELVGSTPKPAPLP